MNENLQEFLYDWAAIIVFILALSVFFVVLKSETETLQAVQTALISDPTVYESRETTSNNTLSGCSLLFSIHSGLESDIEIDGRLISKDTNADSFDYTIIDRSAVYSAVLSVGHDGKLTKVSYYKK
ncbi:MAG: hypothetical protein H7X94_03705 [Vallitaleaceae bacterium]|nr:hypothetical protein [Vallitaleaceae bacterium]